MTDYFTLAIGKDSDTMDTLRAAAEAKKLQERYNLIQDAFLRRPEQTWSSKETNRTLLL